ncbi:hypothetical protein ACFLQ2_02245 [archaeon]
MDYKEFGENHMDYKEFEKNHFVGVLKRVIHNLGKGYEGCDDDAIMEVNGNTFRGFLPYALKHLDDYLENINKKNNWVAFLIICHPEQITTKEKEIESDVKSFRKTIKGEIKRIYESGGKQNWLLVDAGIPVFVENAAIMGSTEKKWRILGSTEKKWLKAKQDWKKGEYITATGRLDLSLLKELR